MPFGTNLSWLAVSIQHGVEGQPPLLTSPRAGKSLIFIQSPPAPLPAQGWTWESPVCPLLCANFRPHYSAVTNVHRGSHFHINTLRPEGKFPLQWIKGPHYCKALPLFPFLAPGVCCFFSPRSPLPMLSTLLCLDGVTGRREKMTFYCGWRGNGYDIEFYDSEVYFCPWSPLHIWR